MKNLKKLSRNELKSLVGGGGVDTGLTGGDPCDICTETQKCCLDKTVYFCIAQTSGNCARN